MDAEVSIFKIEELAGAHWDGDEELFDYIRMFGERGVSVDAISRKFGDKGTIRCGVLTAFGKLKAISGGGEEPYVLAFNDPADYDFVN